MCVHQTDGTAWCRGTLSWQDGGQFNLGEDGNPGATWRQWGDRSDIVELATSLWQQMCARYEDGTAECTGWASATGGLTYTQSRYPFLIGGPSPPVESIWVDVFGAVRLNDPNVYRAADDGLGCTVRASGLFCTTGPIADVGWETTWGTAGNVVHGGLAGNRQSGPSPSLGFMTVCWLDGQGVVSCSTTDHFGASATTTAGRSGSAGPRTSRPPRRSRLRTVSASRACPNPRATTTIATTTITTTTDYGIVRTTGPDDVIATLCSKCADSDPSSVRTVQPSLSMPTSARPAFTMGSMARTIPSRSFVP